VVWNITLVVKALAIVVRSVVWVGKVIVGSLSDATKFIYKFLLPVRLIAQAFVAAGKIIYSVWQILTGDVSLLDGLKAIGGAVFDFLATPFRWARDVISGVWNFISSVFDGMVRFFVAAGERIVSVFMNLPLVSTLRNLFATVRSFFSGDMTFFEAGKKMLVTLGEGIWSAVTYPFRMLKNALGKLRSLLPFSDAGLACRFDSVPNTGQCRQNSTSDKGEHFCRQCQGREHSIRQCFKKGFT
jgi:phage-related protein